MKLGKDKKFRFMLWPILTVLSVSVIVIVSCAFILNNKQVQVLKNNPIVEGYMDVGRHTNNVLSDIGGFISDAVHFRGNANKVEELKKENDKLKQEIINLKSDESKADSLKKLKSTLNFVSGDERIMMVSARVIGKNDGDWFKSFIIDVGADSGVRKDSIVVNGEGAVGIVYSVSNKYCKAISLIDSRASISFKIVGKDAEKGVITTSQTVGLSSLKDIDKLLSGYMFDSTSSVKVGDELVTSGLGLYPENIPIGKVTEVISDKNKSMKIIKVRPYVDFKSINYVSVIPPRKLN